MAKPVKNCLIKRCYLFFKNLLLNRSICFSNSEIVDSSLWFREIMESFELASDLRLRLRPNNDCCICIIYKQSKTSKIKISVRIVLRYLIFHIFLFYFVHPEVIHELDKIASNLMDEARSRLQNKRNLRTTLCPAENSVRQQQFHLARVIGHTHTPWQ